MNEIIRLRLPSQSINTTNGIMASMQVSGSTRSKPCAYFVILYAYTLLFQMNFNQHQSRFTARYKFFVNENVIDTYLQSWHHHYCPQKYILWQNVLVFHICSTLISNPSLTRDRNREYYNYCPCNTRLVALLDNRSRRSIKSSIRAVCESL